MALLDVVVEAGPFTRVQAAEAGTELVLLKSPAEVALGVAQLWVFGDDIVFLAGLGRYLGHFEADVAVLVFKSVDDIGKAADPLGAVYRGAQAFDLVRFQQQCHQLAAGQLKRNVMHVLLQFAALFRFIGKVLRHPLFDVDAFADIDHIALLVVEIVDAALFGQRVDLLQAKVFRQ